MALTESLPARGAWIEIVKPVFTRTAFQSLPARGAWIEIAPLQYLSELKHVAPRKGSVD